MNNLSANHYLRLNVFQNFVCKNAQYLPTKTRFEICESVVNVPPFKSEINIRKLIFLGRLCLMDHQSLSKRIFSTRLFLLPEKLSNTQPYNRGSMKNSIPLKETYKQIVRFAVSKLQQINRNIRMINDY